jgi:hypothetical protein
VFLRLASLDKFRRLLHHRWENAFDAEKAKFLGLSTAIAVMTDLRFIDEFQKRKRRERKPGVAWKMRADIIQPKGMDALHPVVVDEQLRRKEPVKIETDDRIDAVVTNECVPFQHDGAFVGFAARRTFLFDFGGGPANQAGIAANRAESEPNQCLTELPGGFDLGRTEVVAQNKNERAVGHPGFSLGRLMGWNSLPK